MSPDRADRIRAQTSRLSAYWVADSRLSLEDWLTAGDGLRRHTALSRWWLGDWMRFGAQTYGLTTAEAAGLSGFATETLEAVVTVARSFPRFQRRQRLSWADHAIAARLDPLQRDGWLEGAELSEASVDRASIIGEVGRDRL